ncbi:MAG: DUF86 domain-containing protein [Phycisphaerales bacterium]|nr:DUF86 domain-containing protein [Phycisphaerales bacterium]
MLDHARETMEMARGRRREELDTNRTLNLSLIRLLEIVGEAAARVGETTRRRYSGIQWSQIVGLRNRLIHGYDEVDFDVLWKIVTEDVPTLITELERVPDSDS